MRKFKEDHYCATTTDSKIKFIVGNEEFYQGKNLVKTLRKLNFIQCHFPAGSNNANSDTTPSFEVSE